MDRGLPSVFAQRRNSSPKSNAVRDDGHNSSSNLRGGLLKGGSFRSVTDESMAQEICRHLEWAQGLRDDVDLKDATSAEPSSEQALSASRSKATHSEFAALRAENQILRQRLAKSEATLQQKALHNGGHASKAAMAPTKSVQPGDMLSKSSQERQSQESASEQHEERSGANRGRRLRKSKSVHFSRRSKAEDAKFVRPRLEDDTDGRNAHRRPRREKFAAYSQKVVSLVSPSHEVVSKGKSDTEDKETVQEVKQRSEDVAPLQAKSMSKVKSSAGIDRRVVASLEPDPRKKTKSSGVVDRSVSLPELQRKPLPVEQESTRKSLRGVRKKGKRKEVASPQAPKTTELGQLQNSESKRTSASALRDLCTIMRSGSRANLGSGSGDADIENAEIQMNEIRPEKTQTEVSPRPPTQPRSSRTSHVRISLQSLEPPALQPQSSRPSVGSARSSLQSSGPLNLNREILLSSIRRSSANTRSITRTSVFVQRKAPAHTDNPEQSKVHHLAKDFVAGIFKRLQNDGEVHKDSLPWALQLGGYPKANPDWIHEELRAITSYDSVDLNEFLVFFESYEVHEHNAAKELFHKFDLDHNGLLDLQELPQLFQSMGINPLTHVVRDIVKDVSPETPDNLTFEEFWEFMLHLRANEGFTRAEVKYFEDIFRKFDADDSGSLESKELSRILVYLGHAMEEERVMSILKEVDYDNNGSLDIREFVVCMRKVREYDVENMQTVFDECDEDGSGGIQGEELVLVLRQLGYFPEIDDITDACADINISIDDELDFDQLWEFLQTYRGREGFSHTDMSEIREVFETAEQVKNGEIEVLELGRLFALLGCIVPCDQIQCFVANVDIDGSGFLDLKEFTKVVRQSYHFACQQAQKTFVEHYVGKKNPPIKAMVTSLVPGAHTIDVERIVSRLMELKKENDGLDSFDFVSAINTLKKKTSKQAKRNFGFGVKEVNDLRALFTKYDADRSGVLRNAEAITFFESEYPEVAMCLENRPILMGIMQNAQVRGAIDFRTFLRLVRKCQDLADHNKIKREREAITRAGFSGIEVKEFRELFLTATIRTATIEQEKETVTLPQLMHILKGLVAPSQKNNEAIKRVFYEVVDGKEEAEFSSFLLIFRQLLDLDIGKISFHAARRVAETCGNPQENGGSRVPSHQQPLKSGGADHEDVGSEAHSDT